MFDSKKWAGKSLRESLDEHEERYCGKNDKDEGP
jgi:hypothetical protein